MRSRLFEAAREEPGKWKRDAKETEMRLVWAKRDAPRGTKRFDGADKGERCQQIMNSEDSCGLDNRRMDPTVIVAAR